MNIWVIYLDAIEYWMKIRFFPLALLSSLINVYNIHVTIRTVVILDFFQTTLNFFYRRQKVIDTAQMKIIIEITLLLGRFFTVIIQYEIRLKWVSILRLNEFLFCLLVLFLALYFSFMKTSFETLKVYLIELIVLRLQISNSKSNLRCKSYSMIFSIVVLINIRVNYFNVQSFFFCIVSIDSEWKVYSLPTDIE